MSAKYLPNKLLPPDLREYIENRTILRLYGPGFFSGPFVRLMGLEAEKKDGSFAMATVSMVFEGVEDHTTLRVSPADHVNKDGVAAYELAVWEDIRQQFEAGQQLEVTNNGEQPSGEMAIFAYADPDSTGVYAWPLEDLVKDAKPTYYRFWANPFVPSDDETPDKPERPGGA